MAKNKLNYAGMQKRIAATSGAPSGTPVYSREPRTASYQDSMMAYNSIKGKAAGAENLKPKGAPKKYVGMQPNKPAPKKK
jgi:hypothetical protein